MAYHKDSRSWRDTLGEYSMPEKSMNLASDTTSPLVFRAADKSQHSHLLKAASNVFFALSDAFTKCFSRVTQSQFKKDHHKALLASNSIEDSFNFSDELAMELRRRVLVPTSHSYRDRSNDSDKRYHKPWIGNDGIEPEPDCGPRDILKPQHGSSKHILRACTARKVSIGPSEEEPISENNEVQQWLLKVDPVRAQEYIKYVAKFQAHGLITLNDLAKITSENIEDALSEIGIYRFMHRARLRQAILRINDDKVIGEV